jgi:actin-like ATPase involved in cell morphogenesis
VWARHAPGETPPPVDFSAAMVVAVFTGSVRISVIPSVSLAKVVEQDAIDITVDNYVNDVIYDERANLYLFVVLRRSAKLVRVIGRSFCIMCQPQETVQVLEEFKAMPEKP